MRPIDANALMDNIRKHCIIPGWCYPLIELEINQAPTIEAVSVHGNKMQDFSNDLIRRTDALNMVHNFFLAKIKAVCGDREEIPMGEFDPFLKDNKELSAKIKSIPNFEAVPVVHAEWIPQNDGLTKFVCSNCKTYNQDGFGNYCRHCGAKMDGKAV